MICTKIVLDPKECSKCQTLFCKTCIEKWQKEKRYCPLQCPDAEYVKIHKFVNNILMELRFNCPMKDCPKFEDPASGLIGYPYAKAIEHQKNCEYRRHFCELGCGAKLYKKEVEEHLKICPERVEVCEKCGIEVKVN